MIFLKITITAFAVMLVALVISAYADGKGNGPLFKAAGYTALLSLCVFVVCGVTAVWVLL